MSSSSRYGPLWIQHIPLWRASSPSKTLLLLVAGTSTGAVVVPLGALVELGVSSRSAGGFFFLRRLHRPRRPFLTWAKASSAVSKKHCLVCGSRNVDWGCWSVDGPLYGRRGCSAYGRQAS